MADIANSQALVTTTAQGETVEAPGQVIYTKIYHSQPAQCLCGERPEYGQIWPRSRDL